MDHGSRTGSPLPTRRRQTVRVHPELVRVAHADVWEAHGRHREAYGGGAIRLAGVRLMAAGLPHPQWNSGDVIHPESVDIEAVRRWYADKRVPFGLRLPAGDNWGYGRYLLSRGLMALDPSQFRAVDLPVDVSLRAATPEDVDDVFKRALANGAKEERPVENQFYGDRAGQFEDPFGHKWFVASHVEDVPPDEMAKRAAEAMGG